MGLNDIKIAALEQVYEDCDEKGISGQEFTSKYGLNGIQDIVWGFLPSKNLDILDLLIDMPYLLDFKAEDYRGADFRQRLLNALNIEISNKLVSDVKEYNPQ